MSLLDKKLIALPEWPAGPRRVLRVFPSIPLDVRCSSRRGPAGHSGTVTSPIIVNGAAPHPGPLPQNLEAKTMRLYDVGADEFWGEGTNENRL